MSVLETKFTSQPHANIFILVAKAIPWVLVDWDPILLPKGFFPQIEMSWPGEQQTLCILLCWLSTRGSCFISPSAVPSSGQTVLGLRLDTC